MKQMLTFVNIADSCELVSGKSDICLTRGEKLPHILLHAGWFVSRRERYVNVFAIALF